MKTKTRKPRSRPFCLKAHNEQKKEMWPFNRSLETKHFKLSSMVIQSIKILTKNEQISVDLLGGAGFEAQA